MLVLTRKLGEEIIIGDGIRVQIVAIDGHRVRLGFSAPPDVRIYRQELLDAEEPAAPARQPVLRRAAPAVSR